MATTPVQLNGLPELLAKLENVSDDMRRKGGRFALRKAAQIVRNTARANAQQLDRADTPNKIYKNIEERWNGRLFKATGNLGFRVGVAGGAVYQYANTKDNVRKQRVGKEFHVESNVYDWRFLEFGTEQMAAQAFFRRALPESAQAATNEFVNQYKKALDRALKKKTKGG